MCHEWSSRREKRREEQVDEELRYLLDEQRTRWEPATPIVEYERDQEPAEPERVHAESGAR